MGFSSSEGGFEPPRMLGRYELIGTLGTGGMASVYLARTAGEAGFQRMFAVKILHPHLAKEAGFISMLLDEARIAARLHHPNVVPIVDLGSQDGAHYVAMEYIEGCSLSALLKKKRDERPARYLVPLMLDALAGLDAAHSLVDDDGEPMNLVHRDVSPQNILVSVDGTASITDFGIARAEARISATRPGQLKGKYAYMSPEQIRSKQVDRRSDVFSAGAVLWSMLTGRKLFQGEHDAATMSNILELPIPPPSAIGLKPPAAFDQVCLRALARDPNVRFAAAADMEDALRKAAMAAGELATRREVAAWVGDAFREEIAERRDAIRAALSGGHDRKPSRLPGTRPTLDLGAFTPSGVSEAAVTPVALIQPTASISLDTQVDPATATTQPVPRMPRSVDTQTKTPSSIPAAMMQAPKPSRAPWLALAVALPVLGGGGYFAYRAMQNTATTAAPAPVAAAQPQPAAAVPPAAPKPPAKIDVGIDSDTPGARVVFRRRIAGAPMTTNIAPSDIVELVEVSAPGYKTERYWLTFDRATHLHAHLAKGNGIEEASEEQTLVALGEQSAIEETRPAAAPVHVTEKTVAQVSPAAAVAPQSTPRRKIGRSAVDDTTVATERVEQRAHVAMEAPALASAPAAAPALPEPSPAMAAPTPAAMPAVAQPAVRPAPAPVAVSAKVVPPAQFRALIASNGQIEPSELVQSEMMRDEKKKAGAFVKVCIGTAGEVTSASIVKSSGYPDYDAALVAGVRGWHFHAYTEGGRATPACSAVVFSFTLR